MTIMSTMTQTLSHPIVLTVDVENMAVAREIKRALKIMRGVTHVHLPRRKKLTGYEQARLDVKEGRICSYDSLDDFIKEIENG